MADFQLLINKIQEVKEKLDAVNDTVATMDRQPIDNLASAFQLLYDKLCLYLIFLVLVPRVKVP